MLDFLLLWFFDDGGWDQPLVSATPIVKDFTGMFRKWIGPITAKFKYLFMNSWTLYNLTCLNSSKISQVPDILNKKLKTSWKLTFLRNLAYFLIIQKWGSRTHAPLLTFSFNYIRLLLLHFFRIRKSMRWWNARRVYHQE